MKGTDFPESVTKLGAPEGMEDEVYALPIWTDGQHPALISKWRMTWKERLMCLWQGYVWLHVLSRSHPPVTIETSHPFERDSVPVGYGIRRSAIFVVVLTLAVLIGTAILYFSESF